MGIGLYTSRVVLQQLGVADYGLYTLIGGIIAFFSIISNTMELAIGRFLNFEIGRDNHERLVKVFGTALRVQILLGIGLVLLGEIIGPWLLNDLIVIAPEKMHSAWFVYQCSLFLIPVSLFTCPFNAAITAHEDMKVYAYMSIYTALIKLSVALYLIVCPYNKLETYALLLALSGLVMPIAYCIWCRRKYRECRNLRSYERGMLKEILSFSGWNLIGSTSFILRTQGINVLLNIFTRSTVVNAAASIANTVVDLIYTFVGNFLMALNPTIIKTYAVQNFNRFVSTIYTGTKLSTFLLMMLTLPIFIDPHYILYLWLGEVPEYSVVFLRLIIICSISDTISRLMITGQNATGKIRNYIVITGSILLMTLPLAYLFLKIGLAPRFVYVAQLITSFSAMVVRAFLLKKYIPGWSPVNFLVKVAIPIILVSSLSAVLPYILTFFLPDNFLSFIILVIASLCSSTFFIWVIGLNCKEQKEIKIKLLNIFRKYI